MRAYEGNEPYIFMSYAHKDSAEVFWLMEQLMQRGYRIWYDDGIEPGSEWPENIAQHLLKAHVFITCISENSMESMNCRREINFALSKNKPFLSIYLERTNVPPGMELQISAQQSILKYNYNDEKRFLDKIESCSYLSPCKEFGFEAISNETVLNEELSEDINRNRNKNRFPLKSFKTKMLVGVLIGVIVLLLALVLKPLFTKDSNTENQGLEIYSTNHSQGYKIEYISVDEALSFFEEGKTGLLFFQYQTARCPWCIEAKPVLEQAAKSEDVTIYMVKTRDEEDNMLYNEAQKKKFEKYFPDYMELENGEYVLYVPLVLAVKDGTVVGGRRSTFDNHDATKRQMTDKEKAELLRIYLGIIQKIK